MKILGFETTDVIASVALYVDGNVISKTLSAEKRHAESVLPAAEELLRENGLSTADMDAFAAGRANILVSTTVIEVGVDVPNASIMVIENAERFGLAQLHQLRGRVGRGSEKSYCVLMHGNKVSKESRKRLELMCATENGFDLAEEDMKMRGPGDLEGTQQSGLPISLNIASLAHDGQILSDARSYAEHVLAGDPTLTDPVNASLAAELRKDKYSIKDYSKIS